MCEHAARTFSRVAVVVPSLKLKKTSCLPSAASNLAQPPSPAVSSTEPAIVRAATRRCTVHSLRSVTASTGQGDPGTVRAGGTMRGWVTTPATRRAARYAAPTGGADGQPDRGLCPHRRHAVGGPDQPGRLGGLAMPAPLRLRRLLRRTARRRPARALE